MILNTFDGEKPVPPQLAELERENRKLRRENTHLKNAITQEKLAATTVLNQYKSSTFIQRERERYLALLLANSPSIILILNHTSRIEFCSEYFITKAGFASVSDLQGRVLTDVLAPFLDQTSHEILLAHIQTVLATNTPLAYDVRFCFDQAETIEYFTGLLVPMKDEQNSTGIMLMFQDITDLKRSREEALAASKAKSDFLSNMSHEIRTPMNAIIGMTSIGKREKDLSGKDYAFAKIESASTHLLGIINDILDISKIESGKMDLSHVVFDFKHMLDRVLNVVSLKIKDKHQHFSLALDPQIPEMLFGDDQRLAQVITNIVSNATKFTPENGSISVEAKLLSLQNSACVVQISVQDTGIGMSEQEQSKLFSIFQQAEAGTARKYGGSGLGLAISKRILELMGGNIWVQSEKGKGACFYFTVQLDIPNPLEAAAVSKSCEALPEPDNSACDFSGKVMLLADDIEINLEIAITLLEPTNITIDTAKNGQEAFEAVAANPGRYDIVLMDVQMPEVDGLQATKMIRAINTPEAAALPIIAMTANVFKEDVEKCLEAGMNDHLGKPIAIDHVIAMLARYLHPAKSPRA